MTPPGLRVIICGGRQYRLTDADCRWLDALHATNGIVEVIHGGARGADADADEWARGRNIPTAVFEADWTCYGAKAGPLRNALMLSYLQDPRFKHAHMVIGFPGGRGTLDMLRKADTHGVPVLHAGKTIAMQP